MGLAQCVEFLMPMGYDLIAKQGASSNAPLPTLTSGMLRYYIDAGVPPSKIILGLPLYGYSFPCGAAAAPACDVPPTSDPAAWQVGLGTVLGKIAAGEATLQGFDAASGSPYMEYVEARHAPLGRRQVWYEDASSLSTKAHALVAGHALAGWVGGLDNLRAGDCSRGRVCH